MIKDTEEVDTQFAIFAVFFALNLLSFGELAVGRFTFIYKQLFIWTHFNLIFGTFCVVISGAIISFFNASQRSQ